MRKAQRRARVQARKAGEVVGSFRIDCGEWVRDHGERKVGHFPKELQTDLKPSWLAAGGTKQDIVRWTGTTLILVPCLVSRRYERGSIVITSNKAFGEWWQVFSNCGEPGTVEELLGAAIRRMRRLSRQLRQPDTDAAGSQTETAVGAGVSLTSTA